MSKPNSLSQVEHIVWHPVESVMPDDDIAVLIRTNDCVWIGHYLAEGGWHYDHGARCSHDGSVVTHWAELPEGPKQ